MRLPDLRITSLQARIAIVFTALLLVVQMLGYFSARTLIGTSARANSEEQLQLAERVFGQIVQAHRDRLAQAAAVVASDFGFREAVSTNNQGTIVSALRNSGDRIKADVVMLIGLDGRMLADTRVSEEEGKTFAYPDMIAQARRSGTASAIARLDGKLFELVVVPVRAPVTIGWVSMGFLIDERFIGLVTSTTSLDVTFLDRTEGDAWKVLASSLPVADAQALAEPLSDGQAAPGRSAVVQLPQGEFGLRTVELHMGNNQVVAVLQKSIAQAMAPFLQIQSALVVLAAAGLVLSVAISLVMARTVTQPVALLARFARAIGEGRHPEPLAFKRHDELGELADTFNHMQGALVERERRITGLAYQDGLTSLPNRALFLDRLQRAVAVALAAKGQLAVIMMDLDRFKDVNDPLGPPTGDQLLLEVGQRLRSALPQETATVARLGGDEFALLLPDGTEATAYALGRELQRVLERPILVEGQWVDVSASIGIVTCPQHGQDAATLMRHADIAMYAAKRAGAGCLLYDTRHDTHTPERLSLMGELRDAVEHDNLTLYYQPKADLSTGEVNHVEALVRWEHATRGFIPPDRFIPFAEQTGYIKAITRWVVTRAIAQCADWNARGLHMAVSVNVSARDLLGNDFPELCAALLQEHKVDPKQIWIEITESAVMDDPAHALGTLERLHSMGLRLAIDDFGTGYSSLAYLKRMPVAELKIDKSFVMGMAQDPDDQIIVRSTIDLGHNMGLKVVAEGVDNEASLNQLRALKCDMAQGYLLARPLPAKKLEEWLQEWPTRRATLLKAQVVDA